MHKSSNDLYVHHAGSDIVLSVGERRISLGISDTPTALASTTEQIDKKIMSFANLPIGWDYGDGGPITADVITMAQAWNKFLRANGAVTYTDAFPGDESVTVAAGLRGAHYIEVIIGKQNNSHTFSVAHDFKRKQQFYKIGVSAADALKLVTGVISEVLGALCTASISFTQAGTTSLKDSLLATHSATTGAAFHLSGHNALTGVTSQFVTTFDNSSWVVHPSAPTLQFSGGSIPTRSRQVAA